MGIEGQLLAENGPSFREAERPECDRKVDVRSGSR